MFLFGGGIASDDFSEFADPCASLPQFEKREPLLVTRGDDSKTLGIIHQQPTVFVDGASIICLRIGNFAQVKPGIRGKGSVAVIFEVVLEFLPRQLVLATRNIAQAI